MNARLNERRQANATISYLLARRPTIEAALIDNNILGLSQTLVPMQGALGLTYINVYGSNGARMLQLGGNSAERIDSSLVARAILGHDGSAWPPAITAWSWPPPRR